MKNRCSEIEPLLEGFLDGSLSKQQNSVVREHLRECAACRSETELDRQVLEALTTLPEIGCPEGVFRRIEEITSRDEQQTSSFTDPGFLRRLSLRKAMPLGVAAAAIVVLMVLYPLSDRNLPAPPQYSEQEVVTARAVARESLTHVFRVINRAEREAARELLMKDLPQTVRRTIRHAKPFLQGGHT